MKKAAGKNLRRGVVFLLCAATLAALSSAAFAANGSTTVVTEATTLAGIDWGHGVTTDVILEWAVTIAGCLGAIFVMTSVAVAFVLERKKK